jgi:uncharacterized protein (TIGR03435 family)
VASNEGGDGCNLYPALQQSSSVNCAAALAAILCAGLAFGQEFDVASIKRNKSVDPAKSNVPLGPGSVNVTTGGLFSATGYPLVAYIAFAYDLVSSDIRLLVPQLPAWAMSDRYDIQARAPGNPAKRQMRPMMQALLAERSHLAVRREAREAPVAALLVSKAGKLGPQLLVHSVGAACTGEPPSRFPLAGGFPALCGEIGGMPPSTSGRQRFAGRNVTIAQLVRFLPGSDRLDVPVVDETGLAGTYDLVLEYTPDYNGPPPPGVAPPDPNGPPLMQALTEQLGLRLERRKKGTIEVLVVAHVERPVEN